MINFLLLILFVVVVLSIISFVGWCDDKREWNKGKCECGTKWRYFDTDSSGSRGYMCDNCDKGIWVSSSVEK